jgi:glycosyltransferase involved in cell wall biosynthesis
MKLLFVSNTTNPDNISTDSGWIFAGLLLRELVRKNIECTFMGPMDICVPGVTWIEMRMSTNKFSARFDVPVAEITRALQEARPTHILLNQVEHAPAVRAAVVSMGLNATLMGYCHYIPGWLEGDRLVRDDSLALPGAKEAALFAFCSGVYSCDIAYVHSEYAQSVVHKLLERFNVPNAGHVKILPPPADPQLLSDEMPRNRGSGNFQVIYNHRLYRHFGSERLIEVVRQLSAISGFDVIVTDILGDRNADRVRLDPYPEHAREQLEHHGATVTRRGSNRYGYRTLLAESDAAIAPMRPGCPWSMSVIDCFGNGIPVVGWDVGWFSEAILPPLRANSDAEVVTLIEKLRVDFGLRTAAAEWGREYVSELTPDAIADRFLCESRLT